MFTEFSTEIVIIYIILRCESFYCRWAIQKIWLSRKLMKFLIRTDAQRLLLIQHFGLTNCSQLVRSCFLYINILLQKKLASISVSSFDPVNILISPLLRQITYYCSIPSNGVRNILCLIPNGSPFCSHVDNSP